MGYGHKVMHYEEDNVDLILVDDIFFCDSCKSEQGFRDGGECVKWKSVPEEDNGGHFKLMRRTYCINCNTIKKAPFEPPGGYPLTRGI